MSEDNTCAICKEINNFYAIGSCDHKNICVYCALKSRLLYKDLKCPICTAKLEDLVIFEFPIDLNYAEIDKNDCYKDSDFGSNGVYYLDISAKEEVLKLNAFICPISNCNEPIFENLLYLMQHMKKSHNRFYCDICIKEGKRFLSEATVYNTQSLRDHLEYGEYDEDCNLVVPIHPECKVIR